MSENGFTLTGATTLKLVVGDCRESLRSMPAESVQCCVTSPPYWGLRDYGIEGQLGLEKTPEEYVAKLVDVFREVRRVLRNDGVLWLNLGSSYASSTSNQIQSPLLSRARACDSDGKGFGGYQVADRACFGFCDELQDETQTRRGGNVRSAQCDEQGERLPLPKVRDSEHLDFAIAPLYASLRDVQQSTRMKSFVQHPGAFVHEDKASVSQKERQTLPLDDSQCADNSACMRGNSPTSVPLVVRTTGKESFFSACGRSDCNGIGRCGLCWCNLAIPSLSFKGKDLVSIPQLVAFALQADGWYLRQDIIWAKPSPMPESVQDRCTKAHEYIFLLTKSERYYFDACGIKEPSTGAGSGNKAKRWGTNHTSDRSQGEGVVERQSSLPWDGSANTRNKRSVWNVATRPYKGAHFATFPAPLIEPCVLAGTSREGACAACGAPYRRKVDKKRLKRDRPNDYVKRTGEDGTGNSCANSVAGVETTTLGWVPTCACGVAEKRPCLVLDPFNGSGTTGVVARDHGCDYVGIDLNPEYANLTRERWEKPPQPNKAKRVKKAKDAQPKSENGVTAT